MVRGARPGTRHTGAGMTRALLVAALAAVLLAATAHAQQCQCPAPSEPPVVVSPLVTPVRVRNVVWLAWAGR